MVVMVVLNRTRANGDYRYLLVLLRTTMKTVTYWSC
jgi:hypothetical protein